MKHCIRSFTIFSITTLMLLLAVGCGNGKTAEPVVELPEPVLEVKVEDPKAWYLTSFTQVDYNRGNRFDFCCVGAGGFYVSREEFETYTDTTGKLQERAVMCLYRVDADGTAKKLTGFHPLTLESEHSGRFSVACFAADEDGCIAVLEEDYRYWSDAPAYVAKYSEAWYAQYNATEQYYIRRLDLTGKELSCAMLEDPTESGYIYMHGLLTADEDTVLTLCSGLGVCAYNYEGKLLYTIPLEFEAEELIKLGDRVAVLYRSGEKQCLQILNQNAKSLGESCFLPEGAYAVATGGASFDFYYTDLSDGCLYGGRWNGTVQKLFCWMDCGVDGSFVEYCEALDEETIVCVSTLWRSGFRSCNSGIARVKLLAKEESGVLPVTLASLHADRDVTNFAVTFNRTLSGSNIVIRDYSAYGDKAALRLRSDLMDSVSPDLIDLNDLDREELIRSGLLTDLRPYMKSSGIQLASCIQNEADKQGGIFGTSTQFTLTLNLEAVPYSEKTIAEELPKELADTEGVEEADRDIPEETASEETVMEETEEEESKQVEQEEVEPICMSVEIRNMEELYRLAAIHDNFAGYELRIRNAALHPETEQFAICTASGEKAAAWQFLQRYFSVEYQKENVSAFPTNGELLEQQLLRYTEPQYEILDDGTYLEQTDGSRSERAFTTLLLEENVELNLFSLSEEQAEWIRSVFSAAELEQKAEEAGETAVPAAEVEEKEDSEEMNAETEALAIKTATLFEAIENLLDAPVSIK